MKNMFGWGIEWRGNFRIGGSMHDFIVNLISIDLICFMTSGAESAVTTSSRGHIYRGALEVDACLLEHRFMINPMEVQNPHSRSFLLYPGKSLVNYLYLVFS